MFKKLKEKYRENHLVRVLLLFIMVFLPWGIAIMIMSNRSINKPDSIALPERICDADAPVYSDV